MKTSWKVWVAAALLFTGTAAARTPVISPPPPPQRPPQVWIDPSLKLEPVALQDVAIDIRIQGFVASTRLDLTFHNPNPRVLEGEFVFPLAEGQSITGYALEVAGRLREGVVVEKETARVAYESTVRRGIDPGLAELTQGNVFRTRLYPLPAQGDKRVRIEFDQPLLDAGAVYRYLLPLAFDVPLRHFRVHAEALRGDAAPAATGGVALSFSRWQENFVAELARENFRPERELAFDLPKPADPVTLFSLTDREDPQWRRFAAQVQSAPSSPRKAAPAPRRIALFYDASGSAATRQRSRELAFLQTWLARLATVEVDLIAFRNEVDPPQRFTIRNGDSTALRAAIEALPLDGASAYGALRPELAADADFVLVIGDGLSNFGDGEPGWLAGERTPRLVFAHAAQTVDLARLTRWAKRGGGQVLNLLAVNDTVAQAQLERRPWVLQSTQVVRGQCADLAPRAPQPAGNAFTLYGRCSADAELELRFGDGDGATVLRRLKPGAGKLLDLERGAFVERLWATARISDLEDQPQRDRAAIVALSKAYGVVTRDTSLLVLDRIEDYVRYGVEPREADLAAQYRARRDTMGKPPSEEVAYRVHGSLVVDAWTKFRRWHEDKHAWLDTLLAPAAALEVQRWQAAPALADDKTALAQARALAKRSALLAKRWRSDADDAARRTEWEHEATTLMLELDTLRQRRLARAPDSDTMIVQPRTIIAQPREERASPRRTRSSAGIRMKAASPPVIVEEASPMSVPAPAPAAEAVAQFSDDADSRAKIAGGADAADGNVASDKAEVSIALREWDPNTPYLARLRAAPDPYAAYLQERGTQALTPAFFLDCADYFRNEAKDDRLALRVLSNLAEIDFENAPLLRVLAYRLQQWNRFDLAVPLFEQALQLRGEEPQSRRDLALALSRRAQPDYARAVRLLAEIVDRSWDSRFPEIETIALHEIGDVCARAPAAQRPELDALLAPLGIDAALLQPLPVDLRVVLGWDADNVDIDLWVIDPLGEVAIFRSPRTTSGGYLSRDFTGGYGPEVFTIRRPIPGTYLVKTHYYANHAQKVLGPVTVQLEFQTHFADSASRREAVTRRLDSANGEIEIGRFTVGAEQPVK